MAEVCVMQLASSTVHSNRAADLREHAPETEITHTDGAASHGLTSCSRASQAAVGECTGSYQQCTDASHGSAHSSAINESAARHASHGQAFEQHSHSALESARDCDSLASALAAVVHFMLHGVLSMQPGLLQTSYAGSALSFITAVQAAWPGESCALGPILDRLSSGVLVVLSIAGIPDVDIELHD